MGPCMRELLPWWVVERRPVTAVAIFLLPFPIEAGRRQDMCATFDLYRIYACIFNSCRICTQDLHTKFLTCIGFHAYIPIPVEYVHEFCVTWDQCLHI